MLQHLEWAWGTPNMRYLFDLVISIFLSASPNLCDYSVSTLFLDGNITEEAG